MSPWTPPTFDNWTSLVSFTPDLFIDLGVGYPNSEAWEARKSWPDTRIIGVEPSIDRYNACVLDFPGTLLDCCIGREDGKTEVAVVEDVHSVNSSGIDMVQMLYDLPGYERFPRTTLPMRSLDSLDKELGPFVNAFIWADIEGVELEMLMGARELLSNGCIWGLNLELWDERQCDGWATSKEVIDFLAQYGLNVTRKWQGGGIKADYVFELPEVVRMRIRG